MVSKVISITKDAITVAKYVASVWRTEFSTEFLYLKTDASGVLKTGGYNRCPVLAGTSNITDNVGYGGFPVHVPSDTTGYGSFTVMLPKNALPNLQQRKHVTTWFPFGSFRSPTCNIKNRYGTVVGTFYWSLLELSEDPEAVPYPTLFISNITISSMTAEFFVGGEFTFNAATSNIWTDTLSSSQFDMTQKFTQHLFRQNFLILSTSEATSLSLAVTL